MILTNQSLRLLRISDPARSGLKTTRAGWEHRSRLVSFLSFGFGSTLAGLGGSNRAGDSLHNIFQVLFYAWGWVVLLRYGGMGVVPHL